MLSRRTAQTSLASFHLPPLLLSILPRFLFRGRNQSTLTRKRKSRQHCFLLPLMLSAARLLSRPFTRSLLVLALSSLGASTSILKQPTNPFLLSQMPTDPPLLFSSESLSPHRPIASQSPQMPRNSLFQLVTSPYVSLFLTTQAIRFCSCCLVATPFQLPLSVDLDSSLTSSSTTGFLPTLHCHVYT